jgi:hypothetical protein
MNFKPSPNGNPSGTSLQGYHITSYKKLEALLGPPGEGDENKVSTEWVLESSSGDIATIYDYKQTTLYDRSYLLVEEFRAKPKYQWHIGARDKETADLLIEWLKVNGL